MREFPTQNMSRVTFNAVHNLVGGNSRWKRAKQENMIGLNNEFNYFTIKLFRFLSDEFFKTLWNTINKYRAPEFWYPNEVIINVINSVFSSFNAHKLFIIQFWGKQYRRQQFPVPAKAESTIALKKYGGWISSLSFIYNIL
ncbi:MAG: hypothetical protein AMJ56_21565 [Anaerolineae bacterium SG8_19]|nr:MAG: hypothetical protein AMJ56_21565 [Anaerolineae bacterium SG8_19]